MTDADQRIINEAIAASQDVIDRGELWLARHPLKHRKKRRRLLKARAELDALRARHGLA